MSINRMSFSETPDWLNSIGFINRLSLRVESNESIIIQKGSLLFGFKREDNEKEGIIETAYGWLVNNDIHLSVPRDDNRVNYYITCDMTGVFRVVLGNFNAVRGIGANVPGIPWYTFNGNALAGKIIRGPGFITGVVVCDDAYWCEFEGVF